MPNAKPDRRTGRTRSALMSAFVDLMLTRGYAGLSVEDVAENANVGRSTFYLHFRNKDDILQESLARPSRGLAVIVGHDVAVARVVSLLEHFHSQRRLNRVFFAQPARSLWVKCLAGLIEPRLALLTRTHRSLRPIVALPMLATLIAEAQIALVSHWLQGRNTTKAGAVAEALIASTHALVSALLQGEIFTPLIIPNERLEDGPGIVRQER
jgi:AcrR family transcriptional regulator